MRNGPEVLGGSCLFRFWKHLEVFFGADDGICPVRTNGDFGAWCP